MLGRPATAFQLPSHVRTQFRPQPRLLANASATTTAVAPKAVQRNATMDTERLAIMIHKLATIKKQPDNAWIDMFLAACLANMQHFRASQLSRTIWGLATLKQVRRA